MIFKIKNQKCFPFSQIVKRNKNSQIGIKKDLKLNQIDNWDLISKNAFKSKVFMDTKNMKTRYARIDDLGFQNLNNPPKCWKMNELKINEIQFIYCCWPQTYKLRSIADVDKMTLNCTSNSINLNRIYDTYQLSSLEDYLNYSSTEQFNLSMNKCRSPWDFDNFKEENERIIAHEEQLSNISLELIKEHNNLLVEQAKILIIILQPIYGFATTSSWRLYSEAFERTVLFLSNRSLTSRPKRIIIVWLFQKSESTSSNASDTKTKHWGRSSLASSTWNRSTSESEIASTTSQRASKTWCTVSKSTKWRS